MSMLTQQLRTELWLEGVRKMVLSLVLSKDCTEYWISGWRVEEFLSVMTMSLEEIWIFPIERIKVRIFPFAFPP